MDVSLECAEKEYITRWTENARQHYDDEDYRWVCDMIKNTSNHRILEIGCGAGYSTLTFLQEAFDVISIDINREAIEHTKELLEDYGLSVEVAAKNGEYSGEKDVLLWQVDLIHETLKIKNFIQNQKEKGAPIDLIILCNPGGQLTSDITRQEEKYLLWGGFTKGEIEDNFQNDRVGCLHKWAMIYAACGLSIQTEIPILLIERAPHDSIKGTFDQIEAETTCRKIREEFRQIRKAPPEGIQLSGLDNNDERILWGAALYFPR